MHQLHRGGAGIARPGPGADHAAAEERVVKAAIVEVVLHHLRDRCLEDEVDHLAAAAEHRLDLGAGRRLALPGVALALAEQLADVVVELLVPPVAVDVALRDSERLEVGLGPAVIDELAQRAAVGERDPEVRVGDPPAQPAALQVEVVDHLLIEQAEHVGAGADHEPLVGERPLERAGAAEPLAALEDEHRAPGPGQVGGGGEPVVAAADDDGVPVARGDLGDRHRQPDLAEVGGDLVRPLHAGEHTWEGSSERPAGPVSRLQAGSAAPWSTSTAAAALRPFSAITLPAGWVAAPQR